MGDNIESAVSNLSVETKKLEIASYYTHGNLEKAKEMLAGTYKDVFALKVVFTSSVYGAALIFLNNIYLEASSCYIIISHSFDVGDIKTNVEWKMFEKSIAENIERKEHDDILSNQLREGLLSALNIEQCGKIKSLVDQNDAIAINHIFQNILQDKAGFHKVNVSVDVELISSLDMEISSTSSKKINPNELKGETKEEEEKKDVKNDEAAKEDNPLSGKEVKLVLRGSLILSPIKGREVSKLVIGDRVKISIIDKSTKAISVAKAFNAISEDGKMHPINGRIVSIKYDDKNGYKIFAIVAKAIYMQIDEEEKNLKVAMDDTTVSSASDSTSKMNLPLVLSLAFVLILLITVIILFLK